MSMPTITHCHECQCKSLTWQTQNKIVNGVQQGRLNSNDIQCHMVLGCDSCSETLAMVSADMVARWLTENGPTKMDSAALAQAIREAMETSAVRNDSSELSIFGERLRVRYYGVKWVHEREVGGEWACLGISEFDEVLVNGVPPAKPAYLEVARMDYADDMADLRDDLLTKALAENERLTKLLGERGDQLDTALDDIEGLIGTVRHYNKDHQVHNEEGTVRRYRAVLAASVAPGRNDVPDRAVAQESRS